MILIMSFGYCKIQKNKLKILKSGKWFVNKSCKKLTSQKLSKKHFSKKADSKMAFKKKFDKRI